VVMVQGTTSHAGKSTLVTALCRILAQDGYRVAPFKAQNMSLNAAVTAEGGEIGRAQYTQAESAGIVPSIDMNPILLKPTDDQRSQIIVRGRIWGVAGADQYYTRKAELWPVVTESLDRLRASHDVVVIEGAGSPAEINLAAHDIVNMRVARYADAPVLLVGDIERGGVFAALYGTVALLEQAERARVRGFIINKFRGNLALLTPGYAMLETRTGIPTLGTLPYFGDLALPEEDSLGLPRSSSAFADVERSTLDVAVIALPHIANFDEFDGLRHEPGVRVRWVQAQGELGAPDLVILPGTKTTAADLQWLRRQELDVALLARRRAGTPIVGICGGYQMLGRCVRDPGRIESDCPEIPGLGLLPVETTFAPGKTTAQVRVQIRATHGLLAAPQEGTALGYEIHAGHVMVIEPSAASAVRLPAFTVVARNGATANEPEGTIDAEGRTLGTSVHGIFESPAVRGAILEQLARWKGVARDAAVAPPTREAAYNGLAALVRRHVDIPAIYRLMALNG
jgi:adenosylcobyric acid synthase